MDAILIPVKDLGEAKQRLSMDLTQQDRLVLGLAMLSDVLIQAQKCGPCYVVTRDPRVRDLCRDFECEVIPENEASLNQALALGTRHAVAASIRRLLVLPADVPAVTESDLQELFACSENVVVASSADGGTNALLRSPADVIETAFGPDSARVHLEAARNAGLKTRHLKLESLLLDVDNLGDLQRLSAVPSGRLSVQMAKRLVSLEPGLSAGQGPVKG